MVPETLGANLMHSLLPKFIRDVSGNFGIMAGLLMLPVAGSAGLAIDLTNALSVKAELQGAADAAAVGSVADRSPGVQEAALMTANGRVKTAEDDALHLFNGYLIGRPTLDVSDIDIEVNKRGNELISQITYTASMDTNFMRLVGIDKIDIQGSAEAEIRFALFQDFYMLLDNSPSMGIAATPQDISRMLTETKNAKRETCAFACHETESSYDNYRLARDKNVTLRLDVVTQAANALMTTAEETRKYDNQFRVAAYSFGASAQSEALTEVQSLTKNLKRAGTKIDTIDLMTIRNHSAPNNQTNFTSMLTTLNGKIASPGDGSSTSERQKVVFFVSDGMGNSIKPQGCLKKLTGQRCQEPINVTTACKALKDRGVKVAVLYTTYLPLEDNGWYRDWIKPFQSEIGPSMEACASPGLFFEVSPTDGIQEAMEALFFRIVTNPRLTS